MRFGFAQHVEDVVLIGGGPAAAALGHALAVRGVRVTLISPGGLVASPNTLSSFESDLPPMETAGLRARFPALRVHAVQARTLPTPLVVLDNGALAQRACAAIRAAGGHIIDATVTAVHAVEPLTVELAPGTDPSAPSMLHARVVVDATGAKSAFIAREPGSAFGVQSAFGLTVRGTDNALPPGSALWMDWRVAGDAAPDLRPDLGPSFLYAFAFDDGRILYEETSLCARTALPSAVLEARLRARLRERGVHVERELDVEHVVIPMGTPLPRGGQQVVAFGAALGLIHPTTGYSVHASLRLAPVVADVIAGALQRHDVTRVADDVLTAVWTPDARSVRLLFSVCTEALLRADAATTAAFFELFFDAPVAVWRSFVTGALPMGDLQAIVWRLFAHAPPRLQWFLAHGTLRAPARSVLSTIWPRRRHHTWGAVGPEQLHHAPQGAGHDTV